MAGDVWRFGEEVESALAALAQAGRPGALVTVEHDAASGRGEDELHLAWTRARRGFEGARGGKRILWRAVQLVVDGERTELEESALAVLRLVRAGSDLRWRVVLVEIVGGDVRATLHCDPGYALAAMPRSCALWVRPSERDGGSPEVTLLGGD
ncbi:MAG TPA: hypothetical protein DEF51_18130 [Myxococcales bacterium]|nr:hypothetical protein [Myxococcales bacterium]